MDSSLVDTLVKGNSVFYIIPLTDVQLYTGECGFLDIVLFFFFFSIFHIIILVDFDLGLFLEWP